MSRDLNGRMYNRSISAIFYKYMELIYPEFLRFKDRVAVPYTALCRDIP